MCDVCSTSLFNAHFTCTECGIIVCIDCHEVRLKGNLHYQGSSVQGYRSRKKILKQNFDSHFWPFCKQQGIVHHPEKLILTQIICGDILKDMFDRVHIVKQKLNMQLDCHCCKKAEVEDITKKSPDTVQVEKPRPKSPKKEPMPTKFTRYLKECPICKDIFKKDSPLAPALHMINRHFGKDLEKIFSPEKSPYKCPKCEFTDKDLMTAKLHLGLDHNELENLYLQWKRRKYSIKNIRLKVDKADNCVQCGMVYNEHQMGFPEIRKHLFTHFGEDINKTVIKTENGLYKCPRCDYDRNSPGTFRDHIGIFHGVLDEMVDAFVATPKPKKKLSLSDYKAKNSSSSKSPIVR